MTKTTKSSIKKKPSRKSTRITKAKKKQTSTSLAVDYFEEIRERTNDFEEIIPELGNKKTKDITSNTIDYQGKQCSVLDDFVTYLQTSNIYKDKMKEVDFVMKGGKFIKAPSLFVACSSEDSSIVDDKLNLANQILTLFAQQMKQKKKGSEGKNYQPDSQTVNLRTLLSTMKERYLWPYTMKHFNFKGGLGMVLSALFQARLKSDKTNTVSNTK